MNEARRKIYIVSFAFFMLFAGSVGAVTVKSVDTGKEGFTDIVLENELTRLVVAPYAGGRIRSFVDKENRHELTPWVGEKDWGGLAAEIVPGDKYPGILRDASFSWELKEGKERAKVILSYAHGSEGSFQGLLFEKEISLSEGETWFDVHLKVTNQVKEVKEFSLRTQQGVKLGENEDSDWMDYITWPGKEKLEVYVDAYGASTVEGVYIPLLKEGWGAVTNHPSGPALVVMFDRSKTEKASSWFAGDRRSTLEWYYSAVHLQPGGIWETDYQVVAVPLTGVVVSASQNAIVGFTALDPAIEYPSRLSIFPLKSIKRGSAKVQSGEQKTGFPLRASKGKTKYTNILLDRKQMNVELVLEGTTQQIDLAGIAINRRNVVSITSVRRFPETEGYFPFGAYLCSWGGGPQEKSNYILQRISYEYRKNYFNTVTENIWVMRVFPAICQAVRHYRMRLIPRFEMAREKGMGHESKLEELTGRKLLEKYLTEGKGYHGWLKGTDIDELRRVIEENKDVILGYDISDEPGFSLIPHILNVQEAFYRYLDKEHATFPILSSHAPAYAKRVPIFYRDLYPIQDQIENKWGIAGRNPWSVAKDVKRHVQETEVPVWIMLQGFSGASYYLLPNEAETRLMLYSVLANGGKGIIYHGFRGVWTKKGYHESCIDGWGVTTPAWEAIGEIAKQFTAIGPTLLKSRVITYPDQSDKVVRIKSGNIVCKSEELINLSGVKIDLVKAKYKIKFGLPVEKGKKTTKTFYSGPAITVGILQNPEQEGKFLVVQNQDVKKRQKGGMEITKKKGFKLWDLYSLSQAGKESDAKIVMKLEFAPGDGHIFYYGPEREGENICSQVHGWRYANEKVLFDLDAKLAKLNGVDIKKPCALAEEAEQAYEKRHNQEAHEKILHARKSIEEVISSDPALGEVLKNMKKAFGFLSDINRLFARHLELVMDIQAPTSPGRQYQHSPDMQDYVKKVKGLAARYFDLRGKIYVQGKASECLEQTTGLVQDAEKIGHEVIPHFKQKIARERAALSSKM